MTTLTRKYTKGDRVRIYDPVMKSDVQGTVESFDGENLIVRWDDFTGTFEYPQEDFHLIKHV